MEFKPNIFIGSSKEGLSVAQLVEAELTDMAEITLWTVAFENGKSNFDNLISQIAFYDYAIMIATGDDVITSRKKRSKGARDNVLFEFGLFAGGLGRSRVFYMIEANTKLPSDLLGLTLPFIEPKNEASVKAVVADIRKQITGKEKTFDLGFLPSTALAYGYFVNFIERTVERLLEDKKEEKVFHLKSGDSFSITELKITILLPNDLDDDMFKKVKAQRLKKGWQHMKVDPKDVRDYDFSIDVSKVAAGLLHLVDIPLTLNALNKSIRMYANRQHIGKDVKEGLLEYREIRNFQRTLEFLIKQSSLARGIVNVEIVDI
ncbi:STING domain-containing protein [Mucilaginibacter segetis]|uniref:CD-NTase-associated protein 12 n=1 Tax=Mucilaginibacter segetis TaxID=2793071 RepID=A0A934PSM6_9SPHI|nr:STING domain-containing protein [Mucilaginibacter segetis]MBK0379334.1 nucleotide-binding protein [Mucilaginibacter segetis]